jgi:glycosyltransferase involved in cell wall biosynthesis
MRIIAVIAARNERPYLEIVLPYLASQDVEVVLIDNDSDDGTRDAIIRQHYPNLVEVRRLPYQGHFDLQQQLLCKQAVAETVECDWMIHQDADEVLQGRSGWGGLRDVIERADAEGFNVVNFEELVMLPLDPNVDDILTNNRLAYFFTKGQPVRLMRAWKADQQVDNVRNGGHKLRRPDLAIWPESQILKHFIVRSQIHALAKYLNRVFAPTDTERGWHGNRLNMTPGKLTLPALGDHPGLVELNSVKDLPDPWPEEQHLHFWQW